MKSPIGRSWALATAAALVFLTASCGAEEPVSDAPVDVAPVEQTDAAPADEPAEPIEPTEAAPAEPEMESEELEGALVASFPADIPLHEGEIISSSAGFSEAFGDPEWGVTLSAVASLEEVDASIRQAYSENGWKIGVDMESAGGYLLVANGLGYTVSITYNELGGPGVTIHYGVSG